MSVGSFFFRVEKFKSVQTATIAAKHNLRTDHCSNIDPSLSVNNQHPIIRDMTPKQFLKERLASTGNYPRGKKLRKDAVLFGQMLISAHSKEPMMNENWDNQKFLDACVRAADRIVGKENIYSISFHLDEPDGTEKDRNIAPHVHVLFVPISVEERTLSFSSIFGSPAMLEDAREILNEELEDLGLHSKHLGAKYNPSTRQEYKDSIVYAVSDSLPEPMPDEPIFEYRERAEKSFKEQKSSLINENFLLRNDNYELKKTTIELKKRIEELEDPDHDKLVKKRLEEQEKEIEKLRSENIQLTSKSRAYDSIQEFLSSGSKSGFVSENEYELIAESIKKAEQIGAKMLEIREFEHGFDDERIGAEGSSPDDSE